MFGLSTASYAGDKEIFNKTGLKCMVKVFGYHGKNGECILQSGANGAKGTVHYNEYGAKQIDVSIGDKTRSYFDKDGINSNSKIIISLYDVRFSN
jgi:hypothetical protein